MKKQTLAVLTFIGLFSSLSFGIQITTQFVENDVKEIENQVLILCEANESEACLQICQDAVYCALPQKACNDCVGLKNQNLRTAFTDLSFLYRRDGQSKSMTDLMSFLKQSHSILVPYNSPLNIWNASKQDQIKEQFLAFCPGYDNNTTIEALLVASLNEDSQIQHFVGVICTDVLNNSRLFSLKYNPDYSPEKIEFWKQAAETPVVVESEGLQLKMSLDLLIQQKAKPAKLKKKNLN